MEDLGPGLHTTSSRLDSSCPIGKLDRRRYSRLRRPRWSAPQAQCSRAPSITSRPVIAELHLRAVGRTRACPQVSGAPVMFPG